MSQIELSNPSAFHPLRLYTQCRVRNVVEVAPAKAAPKIPTREELEKRGAEITMRSVRVMTKDGPATREIPTPRWETDKDTSLAEWVTKELEFATDAARKAAGAPTGRRERILDEWTEPNPFGSVGPHAKILLQLTEHTRYVIDSDEEVNLQLLNNSNSRTIRLRTRAADGLTTIVAHIPPAREYPHSATVTANKKRAAVIEELPT